MIHLTIFLLLTYFIIKNKNPKSLSAVLVNALIWPLLGLLIYFIYGYISNSVNRMYGAGDAVGYAIIPAVISGILLFYYLNKKRKGNLKSLKTLKWITIILVIISVLEIGTKYYL